MQKRCANTCPSALASHPRIVVHLILLDTCHEQRVLQLGHLAGFLGTGGEKDTFNSANVKLGLSALIDEVRLCKYGWMDGWLDGRMDGPTSPSTTSPSTQTSIESRSATKHTQFLPGDYRVIIK